MKQKTGLQMSSSLPVMILLNLSGGTQDACSYFLRDHVFANAQTGNIVLMGCYLISEDLRNSIRYFLPVAFFALVPSHRKDPLAPSGPDSGDYPTVYRRFYPGTVKLACKWTYFLCLRYAGSVLPYCTRQCLCQHHVYRKSAKWHGPFL